MFRKFVCIYLIVHSSIGSNGPFPLPKYCALPIASLDLIVCIYCLNDVYCTCKFNTASYTYHDINKSQKTELKYQES